MSWFRTKARIEDIKSTVTREFLISRSRILVIDDEKPDIIEDLRKARFAVDYLPDVETTTLREVERPEYDLIILDFGNVGHSLGDSQGLEVLEHIKRVRPSAVVLAYTSQSIDAKHAEFFRLADGALSKDSGVVDTIQKVEEYLQMAYQPKRIWGGILHQIGVVPGSKEDLDLQDRYVRGLENPRKLESFRSSIATAADSAAGRLILPVMLDKLIDIGIKAYSS